MENEVRGRGKASNSALFLVGVLLPWIASPIRSEPEPHPDAAFATAAGEPGQEGKADKLDVPGVETLLRHLTNKNATEEEILTRINEKGIGFVADQKTLDMLVEEGAKDSIIRLIKRLAPVLLTVTCTPFPCEIKVNDGPYEPAPNGRLERPVSVGPVTVNARKAGYKDDPKSVNLTENGSEVSLELKPKTARLRVSCVPADCKIELTDGSGTTTSNGPLDKPDVRVGPVTLNITKEGYETHPESFVLPDAGRDLLGVTLRQEKGSLSLQCEPRECGVKLNNESKTTENGHSDWAEVPAGNVNVEFIKEGYESAPILVVVKDGLATKVRTVTLQPNSGTQAANGKKLLAHMLKALVLDPQKPDTFFLPLTGSGSITFYAKGKASKWNLDLRIGTPDPIEMTATRSNSSVSLTYLCKGQGCTGKNKGIPADEVEGLEASLKAFAQYRFGPVFKSLLSPSNQLAALTADDKPEADQHLSVSAYDVASRPSAWTSSASVQHLPVSAYDVALDRNFRPTEVAEDKSGRKISFSDYDSLTAPPPKAGEAQALPVGLDRVRYPRSTTIHLPNAEQHGVEVRLTKVEYGK
jgi:hypothetical protein